MTGIERFIIKLKRLTPTLNCVAVAPSSCARGAANTPTLPRVNPIATAWVRTAAPQTRQPENAGWGARATRFQPTFPW